MSSLWTSGGIEKNLCTALNSVCFLIKISHKFYTTLHIQKVGTVWGYRAFREFLKHIFIADAGKYIKLFFYVVLM